MNESRQLLAEYAEGSEAAFRELVVRYLDLVYSTAIRLVNGDSHAAKDVSQIVFLDLARAARSLSDEALLGGWLHRHTVFVAAKMMRTERRRQTREKEALDMNTPAESNWSEARQVLDEAINQLGAADRTAIVLRFFEGRDFRAVGEALGSNEDAAQKRVTRALDKLNGLLTKRGLKFTSATLAGALSTLAVSAAPAGMAATIGTSVLLAAPHNASALSLIKIMTLSKTQAACVAVLALVLAITPLVLKRESNQKFDLDKMVAEQTAELLAMSLKNQALASQLARLNQQAPSDQDEIQKLRAEAAQLNGQAEKVKNLRREIQHLSLRREGEKSYWQNREEGHERRRTAEAWLKAMMAYATRHNGQLPQSFADADAFFPTNAVRSKVNPDEEFELLYRGSLNTLTNIDPDLKLALFRERKLRPFLHNYGGTNYDKMGRYTALASGDTTWGSVPAGFMDEEYSWYEREITIPQAAHEN